MKDAVTNDRSTVERHDNDADLPERGKDLSGQRGYKRKLEKLYQLVTQGFIDKKERNDATQRYWRIYNCELTTNQAYSGNSQIYLPIVRDAIDARVQRFVGTLFPETGRYADLVTHPADYPWALVGLLDHYVRRSKLKTKARELLRNGEVEGSYNLYVDWANTSRYITKKIEKHPEIEKGIHDPEDTYFDVEEEEVVSQHPSVTVLLDNEVVVLPATCDDIEMDPDAIVARRIYFTEGGLKAAAKSGLFSNKEAAEKAVKQCQDYDPSNMKNLRVQNSESAGVRVKANKKEYVVFEAWQRLKIKGKLRWCRSFFGGENLCLGMTINPNWNDRCSIVSKPRIRLTGDAWSKSPVDAVEQLQYMANDWINMAQDSGQYSLLPIVMTDPEKNPNYASMILSLAAVWQTNPNDTKFVEFPQLWKDAVQFVQEARSQIMQAFGLNPAMVSMGAGQRKNTQAMIAQEQMVALANITDEVQTLEEEIFTPLLQFFFELDQQFRDDEIAVPIYGENAMAATRQAVPAYAWSDRYELKWRGSEIVRSQQANQQMIAGLNILGKLGPQLPNGKKIDIAPIIEVIVQNIYGPRLGARVLIDQRDQQTIPQAVENQIMASNLSAPVHPGDDDKQHIQEVLAYIQQTGDVNGLGAVHLQAHQQQMMAKMQAQQAQMQGGGGPGPRPGAQPGMPRAGQNPAGAIHQDQMQDPGRMPRKPA